MKRLLIVFLCLVLASCSSDDENTPSVTINNYFDLNVGNSWTYQNTATQANNSTSGSETLEVSNIETINNQDYFSFTQSNIELPGLITSILSSGELYTTANNAQLVFTGDYSFAIDENLPSFNFQLDEATIYNQTASLDAAIFTQSNSFTEDVQNIPLNFNYTLTIYNRGQLNELSVQGETYQNVLITEMVVNASVVADLGITTQNVLQDQNVVTILNYFAPDIGLIKSDVTTLVEFEDIPLLNLPDFSSTSSQELTSFSLNIE